MTAEVSAEDFRLIRDQVRDFVRTKVVPREQEIADTNAIPDDLRKLAAEMGLFGYAIPQEWGGLGLDLIQDVELAMEFGYTSLALRSMFGTNNGIAGQVLVRFGTDEQKTQCWTDGKAAPRADGPSRMPPTISPIAGGCLNLANRAPTPCAASSSTARAMSSRARSASVNFM